MSWKIYSLGSAGNAQAVANLVVSKLTELGYSASYTNSSNYQGTLTVTIDGVEFSGSLHNEVTQNYPVYLCVNDATNEIVVCKKHPLSSVNENEYFCKIACFALLHGTNVLTGESGLFLVNEKSSVSVISNAQAATTSGSVIFLHKAMLKSGDPSPFVSDLFWGSVMMSPGVTIAVGADTFVCLNESLYAKL